MEFKPEITLKDFEKLDIRVATVLEASAVEGSDKLIRLVFDLGNGVKRQILTGTAKWYSPLDYIGKQTLILANLAPRKMMGSFSEGMLLSVGSDNNSKPILILLEDKVENGEEVH